MRNIFLGSSSKSKALAVKIFNGLVDLGYNVRPWWTEFPLGSITIDRLIEISNDVDGAIFIFADDDEYSGGYSNYYVARDNVVLEYGLFLGSHKREDVIILRGEGVKLPTDVGGVTYLMNNEDCKSIIDAIDAHFEDRKKYLGGSDRHLAIYSDAKISSLQVLKFPPAGWSSRLLYTGLRGARNWVSVVNDEKYQLKGLSSKVIGAIRSVIRGFEVSNVVSFGCGDGGVDREVFAGLFDFAVRYIPVDINPYLIQESYGKMESDVVVPFGIQADFEDNPGFIFDVLKSKAIGKSLYAFLGGTFGNIERYERRVLEIVRHNMVEGDLLVLEFFTKSNGYEPEKDPRKQYEMFGVGQKVFLAHAIKQHTGEDINSIVSNFEDRIVFCDSVSEVPDAVCFNICDAKSGVVVTPIRRFDMISVVEWLADELNFNVLYNGEFYTEDSSVGRGYVVLTKPNGCGRKSFKS